MEKSVAAYYTNALCFEDLSSLKLYGNWFDTDYRNLFITVERCKNTHIFPDRCEPDEVIDKWLKS